MGSIGLDFDPIEPALTLPRGQSARPVPDRLLTRMAAFMTSPAGLWAMCVMGVSQAMAWLQSLTTGAVVTFIGAVSLAISAAIPYVTRAVNAALKERNDERLRVMREEEEITRTSMSAKVAVLETQTRADQETLARSRENWHAEREEINVRITNNVVTIAEQQQLIVDLQRQLDAAKALGKTDVSVHLNLGPESHGGDKS